MAETRDDVAFLDWDVSIVVGNDVVVRKVSEITDLPVGTQYSVSGVSDGGDIYVVEAKNRQYDVQYPDGDPVFVADGVTVVLPSSESRFTIRIDGVPYVVRGLKPIADSEWPAIFDGRDPPPSGTTKPT
jgi:hypothetical protein